MARTPKLAVVETDSANVSRRDGRKRADPHPLTPRGSAGDVFAGKWTPNNLGLPTEDECPVVPIGIEGELYHLIDSTGQFRSLTAGDFSHAGMQSLFAATPNYPQWAWPRWGKPKQVEEGEKPKPQIESFKDDLVRQALFLACTRKGLFSPTDKMRGRGMWKLRGGQLIYHAGEELWVFDGGRFNRLETGVHEGLLYPRLPPLPAPWPEPIGDADNPGRTLIETLRKWHWERPEVDPVLLLGWLCVAFLGGALEWRSAVLLIGDKGTGKSTLQQGLKDLFGDALFHSTDTTAAGIYQKMAHDSRPVALDELEPGADPRKVDSVVTLMRSASSGGFARRGSSGNEPVEFQLRSAFLFSAINNPLHSAQDLSRVATLRLRELDPTQPRPAPIDVDACGRMVLALLMRHWGDGGERFREILDAYKAALAAGDHSARGQDTYGTLLAAAELLIGEPLAEELNIPMGVERAREWSHLLAASSLPEIEDSMTNWRGCMTWLMTVQVQAWRNGARQTVGQVLEAVAREEARGVDAQYTRQDASRELELTGLGLLPPGDLVAIVSKAIERAAPADQERLEGLRNRVKDAGWALAVPNSSPLVAKLFEESTWRGTPGGAGPWKDAMRQAPAEIVITDRAVNRLRIGGIQQRCSLIVLKKFHDAPER